MSMMIHRAVQRYRELERKAVEKPVEEKKQEKPAPKKGKKTKR